MIVLGNLYLFKIKNEHFKINKMEQFKHLDENGKEFFRHTDFYPEEEIVKLIELKGIKKKIR